MENQSKSIVRNINSRVDFSQGRVAEILRNLEEFLGIPLSLRSTSGEVVCKTDYFYGPCSFIRGTELGCDRCRKVYQSIEKKLIRRKIPYVCLCYSGFLVFAIPLEFRGEMVGTLFGSQIIPTSGKKNNDFRNQLANTIKETGLAETQEFLDSFNKVKTLDAEKQRQKFLQYMVEIGHHFVEMAWADEPWTNFLNEIQNKMPEFGKF